MNPRIETLPLTKLIGKRLTMSYANNKTGMLWGSFMPRRKEISHTVSNDLYSLQVYADSFSFYPPDIHAPFEKWAAVAVNSFEQVPAEMETLELAGGLYAVFLHKGSSTDTSTIQYIFNTWLPQSTVYELDNRPHFELLGEKYRNNDPASEEEFWIPVRKKV